MKKEKIDTIKAQPKPKLVQDIQVFIAFTNFYWRFIQGFSKIAALLISMLKTSPQLAGTLLAIGIDDSKVVGSSGKNNKNSAKSDFIKSVRKVEKLSFPTPNAR